MYVCFINNSASLITKFEGTYSPQTLSNKINKIDQCTAYRNQHLSTVNFVRPLIKTNCSVVFN